MQKNKRHSQKLNYVLIPLCLFIQERQHQSQGDLHDQLTDGKNEGVCHGKPKVGRVGEHTPELVQTYKRHGAIALVAEHAVPADPQQRNDHEDDQTKNTARNHQIALNGLHCVQFSLRFQFTHESFPSSFTRDYPKRKPSPQNNNVIILTLVQSVKGS